MEFKKSVRFFDSNFKNVTIPVFLQFLEDIIVDKQYIEKWLTKFYYTKNFRSITCIWPFFSTISPVFRTKMKNLAKKLFFEGQIPQKTTGLLSQLRWQVKGWNFGNLHIFWFLRCVHILSKIGKKMKQLSSCGKKIFSRFSCCEKTYLLKKIYILDFEDLTEKYIKLAQNSGDIVCKG